MKGSSSTTLAGPDDLDAVAGAKGRVSPGRPRHDLPVNSNGNAPLPNVHSRLFKEGGKRRGSNDLFLAV